MNTIPINDYVQGKAALNMQKEQNENIGLVRDAFSTVMSLVSTVASGGAAAPALVGNMANLGLGLYSKFK